MKSKSCGCCMLSCLSCSISEVRLTLCISGTVAAGRAWNVSSLYNLKATPGPSRPVARKHVIYVALCGTQLRCLQHLSDLHVMCTVMYSSAQLGDQCSARWAPALPLRWRA